MNKGSDAPKQARSLPDQEQRDLITTVLDRNMLVEAAAGTGKTTSMASRMVTMLATNACADVSAMAAVTFTRKAAAELKARFRVSLEKAVGEAGGVERERLEAALERIDQCYVGTIHSFCARLLRERPIEAGIDIGFEEIEEDVDGELREEAWNEFVAMLLVNDPDNILMDLEEAGVEPRDLIDAFSTFCAYPDVAEWPLPPHRNEPPGVEEAVSALDKYLAHITKLLPDLPNDPQTDKLIPKLRHVCRARPHFTDLREPKQLAELLEDFDKDAGVVQKAWNSKEEAKDERDRWNDFRETVASPFLRSWREFRYEPIMRAMFGARDIYNTLRQERGYLNFQDLLMRAATLLRENPHVRRYLGERITHLLIDEFQDTDPIQAEVVFLLADADVTTPGRDWRLSKPRPGSLFLVGDPKQSIYRFRRADIVTYNKVKEMILGEDSEGQPGLLVYLSANFRTTPEIIDWVNEVFGNDGDTEDGSGFGFPTESSEQSPAYVALQYGRKDVCDGDLRGVLRLDIPTDKAYGRIEQAVDYEADLIARSIRQAIDAGTTIPRSADSIASGTSGALDYTDFMIITSLTTQLDIYARKLQEYGIPHEVAGGRALAKSEELKLFHQCLRALVRTDDPVALVAVLRSELFGISDAQLFRFRKAGGAFAFYGTVPTSLSDPDRAAFQDAFDRLRKYAGLLSQLAPVSAFEKIASDLGLLVLAATRPGGDVEVGGLVKAIEILRAACKNTWSASQLIDVLGHIIEGQQESGSLSVLPRENPQVRLMNLHKAKGLEAPVVFLAQPAGGRSWEARLCIDRSDDKTKGYMLFSKPVGEWTSVTLAQPADWDVLEQRERAFLAAEKLRLLYVAATRPGAALVITERATWKEGNLWSRFDQFIAPDRGLENPGPQQAPSLDASRLSPQEVDQAEQQITAALGLCREPTYDARAAKEYALSEGPAADIEMLSAPASPGAVYSRGLSGTEWGSVLHSLLELALKDPESDLVRLAETLLPEYELSAALAPEAADAASSVMRSEIWQRAQQSDRCLAETPFVYRRVGDNGLPILLRGAIDLVFRETDGWVLVDYKTDSLRHNTVETLVRKYAPQLRVYKEAWEQCTGETVREMGFYFTDNSSYTTIAAEGSNAPRD